MFYKFHYSFWHFHYLDRKHYQADASPEIEENFVDVLSVKEFPKESISLTFAIIFWYSLCSSMFGPESGKNGWNQPIFVFYKVGIGIYGSKVSLCNKFLDIFYVEGCRIVERSRAEHDWHAVGSQYITFTMRWILEKLRILKSTPTNSIGYQTLNLKY